MKIGTVALVIRTQGEDLSLIDTLSDDREITLLQSAVANGESDPLQSVYDFRQRQEKEEEEFGDYIESLLCQPFVKPEIQEHGVQWLKSKIRVEQYQKSELEAAKIIAEFAYKVFMEDPNRREFLLAGPTAKVKVRVFVLTESHELAA